MYKECVPMDERIDYENLPSEELDRLLIEMLNRLTKEKRAYLLKWIKKEFPESADRQERRGEGEC